MNKLYKTGKSQWFFGSKSTTGETLLGPCPHCGDPCLVVSKNDWNCSDKSCRNGLFSTPPMPKESVPDWWNSHVDVYFDCLDGGCWRAVLNPTNSFRPDADPCGFGATPQDAVESLRRDIEKHRQEEIKNPPADFVAQQVVITITDKPGGLLDIATLFTPQVKEEDEITSRSIMLTMKFFEWLKNEAKLKMLSENEEVKS